MLQANDSRFRLQSELMERQEWESVRRHSETMAALKDQSQALQALIRGMETVIGRTGGRGTK